MSFDNLPQSMLERALRAKEESNLHREEVGKDLQRVTFELT